MKLLLGFRGVAGEQVHFLQVREAKAVCRDLALDHTRLQVGLDVLVLFRFALDPTRREVGLAVLLLFRFGLLAFLDLSLLSNERLNKELI